MADFIANFTLSEIESIDATFKIDKIDYYPMKTSQLINDNDFVADADYVHTDNNLTNTLKSNYDAAYTHSSNTSNPHAVTKTQVGLGNVPNTDCTNASNITQDSAHRFVSDTEKSTWNGKQDALGFTAENTNNKVTSISGSSTDTQYPSAKLLYDQLATKQASGSYELSTNKETSALDTSTTKYPCNNVVKTAVDGKVDKEAGSRLITSAESTLLGNTSGTNSGNETTTTIGTLINTATEKTTPVDADMVALMDSEESNVIKKFSWSNFKAKLKTYFDTLYKPTFTENTAFNKNYSTTATDIKMNGTQALGTNDTIPRSDHVHPTDTSRANTDLSNLSSNGQSSLATLNTSNMPILANNATTPNTQIDFSAGFCWDDTLAVKITNTALTKKLDANFVAGTGNGGLDTGSNATSTWYHCFAIAKADGTSDFLFSTSVSTPTMPADYTYKRRIGSIKTNSSGNILGFAQFGDDFMYVSPIFNYSAASGIPTSATYLTLSTPLGLSVKPYLQLFVNFPSNGSMQIQDGASGVEVTCCMSGANLSSVSVINWARTDTSSRIKHYSTYGSTANLYQIVTIGYQDKRGVKGTH